MRPVLGLYALSPFVAEFLLGNLTPAELWLYPLLMLLYGSGAVLIREIARRRPAGWAMIPVLGVAYALIEEGPVDQLFWNPGYAGVDLVHTPSYIPFLGTNVNLWLTIFALHAVWSICVPIALVESLVDYGRRTEPWLTRRGLITVFVVYVFGCVLVWAGNHDDYHFTATPFQLAYCSALIAFTVWAAVRVPQVRRGELSASSMKVFGISLLLTSVWWAPQSVWQSQPSWFEFVTIGTWMVVVAIGVRLALQLAWTPSSKLAAAAGAAVTYAWCAFFVPPEEPGPHYLGNVLFAAVLAVILVPAARSVRQPLTRAVDK